MYCQVQQTWHFVYPSARVPWLRTAGPDCLRFFDHPTLPFILQHMLLLLLNQFQNSNCCQQLILPEKPGVLRWPIRTIRIFRGRTGWRPVGTGDCSPGSDDELRREAGSTVQCRIAPPGNYNWLIDKRISISYKNTLKARVKLCKTVRVTFFWLGKT
jgi:hypothetical protein